MVTKIFPFNLLLHFFIISSLLFLLGANSFFYLIQINFNSFFENFLPFIILFCILLSFINENPIITLFFILLSFILLSFVFFYYATELIAYIFLIVYLGAILMLFLFVLMLFNLQRTRQKWEIKKISNLVFFLFFFNFLIHSLSEIFVTFFSINAFEVWKTITNSFSYSFLLSAKNGLLSCFSLYNSEHFLLLFLTILLLFTMLGAITLALATKQSFRNETSTFF